MVTGDRERVARPVSVSRSEDERLFGRLAGEQLGSASVWHGVVAAGHRPASARLLAEPAQSAQSVSAMTTAVAEPPATPTPTKEAHDDASKQPAPAPDALTVAAHGASSAVDCAGRHGLNAFVTTEAGYNCDHCGAEELPAGTTLFGCKICDYDVCAPCHERSSAAVSAYAAVAQMAASVPPPTPRELVTQKLREWLGDIEIGGRDGKGTFEGNYGAVIDFAINAGDAMVASTAEEIYAAYTEDKVANSPQPYGMVAEPDPEPQQPEEEDPEDAAARAEATALRKRLMAERARSAAARIHALPEPEPAAAVPASLFNKTVADTEAGREAERSTMAAVASQMEEAEVVETQPEPVNCTGKHGLTAFVTDEAGYSCDLCGTEELPSATTLFGCEICEYDVCEACWNRPELQPQPKPEPEPEPASELEPEAERSTMAAVGLQMEEAEVVETQPEPEPEPEPEPTPTPTPTPTLLPKPEPEPAQLELAPESQMPCSPGSQLGTANCNINANFPRIFLLKMQEEWRIPPEK